MLTRPNLGFPQASTQVKIKEVLGEGQIGSAEGDGKGFQGLEMGRLRSRDCSLPRTDLLEREDQFSFSSNTLPPLAL